MLELKFSRSKRQFKVKDGSRTVIEPKETNLLGITGVATVGTLGACDIQLPGGSPLQARFVKSSAGWILENLGDPVFIKKTGEPLEKVTGRNQRNLSQGDEIYIRDTVFIVTACNLN